MKSFVICLIILSLCGGGSTSTLTNSATNANPEDAARQFCNLGCAASLCSQISTPKNPSELISSTLGVPILFFYIVGPS